MKRRATIRSLFFSLSILLSVVISWQSVLALLQKGLEDQQQTHILLIIPLTLCLIFLERGVLKGYEWSPVLGGSLLGLTFLAGWALAKAPQSSILSGRMFLLVCSWLSLIILFYGTKTFKTLVFPFIFLFLLVPIPEGLLARITSGLQYGSTATAYLFFKLARMPVIRERFLLYLPTLTIEVAKECSSIRSSMLLLVTSLVVGHLYLRSRWCKTVLALAVFPVSIAKNGLRIFVLSTLGAYVDPSWLEGSLHRDGGILFFALAVGLSLLLVWWLRRLEGKVAPVS
jgi:exosortase